MRFAMLAPEYLEYFGDGIFTRLFDTGTGFEIKMNTKGERYFEWMKFHFIQFFKPRKGKERKGKSSRRGRAVHLD